MNLSRPGNPLPSWRPLALACACPFLAFAPAFAQTSSESLLAPVQVTASRFAAAAADAPPGATLITAEQIREAGIGNVNQAIRQLGGVYGRQNSTGSPDYQLDLRGFGTTGDQNLVVLLDGVRLSENELATALLSTIPIESVERIEIVRGGSSVLYGEGATGGTIQVITKRGAQPGLHGTVVGEVGSFNSRELRAYAAQAWGGFSLDANADLLRTDNYRDNNELRQNTFSTSMQWASDLGRVGARLNVLRQDARLPGALTMAQFQANPRQTQTPDDFGSTDSDLLTLFGERRLGDFDLAAELAQRRKTARGTFVSSFGTYNSEADIRVTQFSPRLRHRAVAGDLKNELVAGLDFSRWTRDTDAEFGGFPSSQASTEQKAGALYLRDEIRARDWRLSAGARREHFDQDFSDPLGFPTTAFDKRFWLNAWELQGGYSVLPLLELYAKAGRSYRVANADENAYTPLPNQPLQPQTSRDLELGAVLGDAKRKLTLRLFRHQLRNEIFYDPTAFANTNLDPTRRQGAELELRAVVARDFAVSANFQHVNASFTDGPNAGREMVLVPPNTASLRLNWLPDGQQSADIGLLWADAQRYGGDFDNSCTSRIPSYVTLDARYARRFGLWELSVSGANLTGRNYFSAAYGACGSGIYPDPGRAFKLALRRDF